MRLNEVIVIILPLNTCPQYPHCSDTAVLKVNIQSLIIIGYLLGFENWIALIVPRHKETKSRKENLRKRQN